MQQLDNLREEIAIAGMYGEIPDFPYLKKVFIDKKRRLEGLVSKDGLNWIK